MSDKRLTQRKKDNHWLCLDCGQYKPLTDFTLSRSRSTPNSCCKPCANERMRQLRVGERIKRESRRIGDKWLCMKCNELKSLEEFRIRNKRYHTPNSYCLICDNQLSNQRHIDNPERTKRNRLKYRYNLSLERFDALLKTQNGRCAICFSNDPGARMWNVDHDHGCCSGSRSCGKCVRGLLCFNCNGLLGKAKDNTEILNSAIMYLGVRCLKS